LPERIELGSDWSSSFAFERVGNQVLSILPLLDMAVKASQRRQIWRT